MSNKSAGILLVLGYIGGIVMALAMSKKLRSTSDEKFDDKPLSSRIKDIHTNAYHTVIADYKSGKYQELLKNYSNQAHDVYTNMKNNLDEKWSELQSRGQDQYHSIKKLLEDEYEMHRDFIETSWKRGEKWIGKGKVALDAALAKLDEGYQKVKAHFEEKK